MKDDKGGNNKMNTSSALDLNSFNSMFDDMFEEKKEPVATVQQEVPEKELEELQAKDTENISNISVDEAVSKLITIGTELGKEFVERSELIRNMLFTLVSGSNMLMIGPPGTGKSMITRALCDRIENSVYFEYMLNKTSDPSEILGSFSVKQMENDKFIRNTTGKLPEANIAFIDEVYKSNAPTLNALLTIMNEHIFYNDGKPVQVPLISMFGASNETPEDDSLLALHDRFLFRVNVEYIHDSANRQIMFNNFVHNRAGMNNNNIITTISLAEISLLQKQTRHIPVPKQIYTQFISLLSSLSKNGVDVSDRRANECFKVMQASALLAGRNKVSVSDFNALKFILWEKEKDQDTISDIISKIANPYDDKFKKYHEDFISIRQNIENASDDDRSRVYFQYQSKINSILKGINVIIAEASNIGKDINDFVAFRQEVNDFNTALSNEALYDTIGNFGIDVGTGEMITEVSNSETDGSDTEEDLEDTE